MQAIYTEHIFWGLDHPKSINEFLYVCFVLKPVFLAFQVRVPQLQVDGGRKRRLPRPPAGLHPPGLSGLRRHLDEAGGQLRQAQTHQQRAGRPGTCKGCNRHSCASWMNSHACCTPSFITAREQNVINCLITALFSCCTLICTQNIID